MLSYKAVIRLSVVLGILTWSLLVLLDLMVLFSAKNNIAFGLPTFAPKIALGLFITCLVIYYRYRINKAESFTFIDLLWRVFLTGLLTTIVSSIIKFIFSVFGHTGFANNPLVINFFYHINLGLILAFTVSTLIVWKRLILYQKTKSLLTLWGFFEYLLIGSLFFDVVGYSFGEPIYFAYLVVLVLIGLVLSFNLKWVAYLDFKQKWKSILFILLVIIYQLYFLGELYDYSNSGELAIDLLNSVFVMATFGFILIYAIISVLVILFNLPTSSVFEQKLKEAVNIRLLSGNLPAGQKEEQVYRILLESTMSAVFADAAWLEINEDQKKPENTRQVITKEEVQQVKKEIKSGVLRKVLDGHAEIVADPKRYAVTLRKVKYRSVLLFPIIVQQKQIGNIALLKEVADGFNGEMCDIISTFVNQASISLENIQLVNEAIHNERYKEELKIANRVQKSLLPDKLEADEHFDIHGYSIAANEVGGDYYDSYRLAEHRFALIMADVSGKGTSAAFNMSQMKGIFHSLAQLDHDTKTFILNANSALSRCLEKTSFITASYYNIDTIKRIITFTRAGHCPTLYYSHAKNKVEYLQTKGLGLGIVRNVTFSKYVDVNELAYESHDILFLYTDGITEALNNDDTQFGYERLSASLLRHAHLDPVEIQKNMFKDLYTFCDGRAIDDDYSILIVKFK